MNSEDVSEDGKSSVTTAQQDPPRPGLLWSMTSGLYNAGAGAVGAGVGGLKWAASTSFTLGTGLVSAGCNTVKRVSSSLPKAKTKSD